MSKITADLAAELFREFGGWFGSPALLTVEPGVVTDGGRELVIDGAVRFEALRQVPALLERWRAGELPHHVFRAERQRSEGELKLLPRMLALAGHYDRAYAHTPETWRQSVADIRAYLHIPTEEAYAVFAHRIRLHKAYVRELHRTDRRCDNRIVVRQIRRLLATADETDQALDVEQLRKVLNGMHTYNRRAANDSGPLHDEPSSVHEDSRNDRRA